MARFVGWTVALLFGLYAALTAAAYAGQRRLIFPAPPGSRAPELDGAVLLRIPGPAGSTVYALHVAAPAGAPTIVHFHGNGEQMADDVWLAGALRDRGLGALLVEYPGYGLAAATPASEGAMYAAAEAALAHLRDVLGVPATRTVLEGQSLGTGVASEMARRGRGARLVLLSPYTSMTAMAAHVVPFLPTRWLVRDRFDTASRAPAIGVPVLIIHGDQDEVVPVTMGRSLARRFPRATFVEVRGAGHNDLFGGPWPSVIARVAAFAREI